MVWDPANVDWNSTIEAAAVVGALAVSAYQTRRLALEARQRDEERRNSVALEMYRDLIVDGDTAEAFHRLSDSLRIRGTEVHGSTTWYLPTDADLLANGPISPDPDRQGKLFADLYRVLWYFERSELAVRHGLVNRDVYFEAAGFHIWWWNQILRRVRAPKALLALHVLAEEVQKWADSSKITAGNGTLRAEWCKRCSKDFAGGGPVDS